VTVPSALADRTRAWIAADPDPDARRELEALLAAGDSAALEARFSSTLEFGTAGLRGALGAGPNRMNLANVRAASAGLGKWLYGAGLAERGVVVGFDHRHQSDRFARETAAVLAAQGISVRLATHAWPTPVTAFAVQHYDAGAGVMVTASHNPAPDNGYKVYDETGSQIIPPVDAQIAAGIAGAGPANEIATDPSSSRIAPLGDEAITAYLDAVAPSPSGNPRDLRVVYTPIHGVGLDVFRALWERAGFAPAAIVDVQAKPDPDFPTAPFPNPEEPGVLDHARALAERLDADLLLANDPDADRLAVAIPVDGAWRALKGDEIGALLGAHMLSSTSGDDRVVGRSIVSSRLLDRIAAAAGVPSRVTLTGFKWVSRVGDRDGRRLVFGYEEALGYAVNPLVRDKDGLTAAIALAELASRTSLADELDRLAAAHGLHATGQWSMRFADGRGAAAFTAHVRAEPPSELDGLAVTSVTDYLDGGGGLPPADLLELDLADGSRVLVRPSGTEPKVKCYFEVVVGPGEHARAAARLDAFGIAFRHIADTMPG
jgi:phosphomannomutase